MLLIFPPALQTPAPATQPPADAGLPCDAKDHQALLIGDCTRDQILAHRAVFKERTDQAMPSEADRARWMAVKRPFTIVAAFGSWCSDSQHELPSFLALDGQPNPFVEVQFIGVARDKVIEPSAWPAGIAAQKAEKVPTAWIFALGPGGTQTLAGSVVEHPAKAGETFAESILDVMEQAR
jgi:hypothetical protein